MRSCVLKETLLRDKKVQTFTAHWGLGTLFKRC